MSLGSAAVLEVVDVEGGERGEDVAAQIAGRRMATRRAETWTKDRK